MDVGWSCINTRLWICGCFRKKTGLPELYNRALRDAVDDPAIMIFVHDDAHLCDFFWPNHILAGLSSFDILGVAGNRRRVPSQLN